MTTLSAADTRFVIEVVKQPRLSLSTGLDPPCGGFVCMETLYDRRTGEREAGAPPEGTHQRPLCQAANRGAMQAIRDIGLDNGEARGFLRGISCT